MRQFADIKEHLIEVPVADLFKYVGYPILVITPQYAYAIGPGGDKRLRCDMGYDEDWIIFDGTITITEGTWERTYWALKCLAI